jgi:hypothetical protein
MEFRNKSIKKLFKKGERVRSKTDGKIMEVIRYIKNNLVSVKEFDPYSLEVYYNAVEEDMLSKAW